MMNDSDNEDRVYLPANQQSIKEKISLFLFDKKNPEMITFLYDSEINKLTAIEEVIKNENKLREELKIDTNIFAIYIQSLKVHRTSRKGWRSEQGVQIIKSNLESDEMTNKNKFGLFGGGSAGNRI